MAAPKGNKYAKGKLTGRKTLFKREYADQAFSLTLLGLTDVDLADAFGVSVTTLNKWKKAHKEFIAAIKRGKIIADGAVVNSLYKRAIGYAYDEVTFEMSEAKAEPELNEVKQDQYKKRVVTKEVAPDTTAQIFWLKNRQPAMWREKQHVEAELKGPTFLDLLMETPDEEN